MKTLLALVLAIVAVSRWNLHEVIERRVEIMADWSHLPTIVVTAREITYEGTLIATVESVMRDDSPTFWIDALLERLEAWRDAHGRDHVWSNPGVLCPEQTVIVKLDREVEPRVLAKIVNTTSRVGMHAAMVSAYDGPAPVIRVDDQQITYNGEFVATAQHASEANAPMFYLDALDQKLDRTPWPWNVELDPRALRSDRTVLVELYRRVDPRVLAVVIATTSRRGLHAAVTWAW